MTGDKVRLRACVVCVDDGQVLLVRLRDPTSGARFLVPPGGAIEVDESPAQAALREAQEETGYQVALAAAPPVVADYRFQWDGEYYAVTTHFYLVRLAEPRRDPAPVHDADYLEGACWVPLAAVAQVLGFHPQICQAVVQLLAVAGCAAGARDDG